MPYPIVLPPPVSAPPQPTAKTGPIRRALATTAGRWTAAAVATTMALATALVVLHRPPDDSGRIVIAANIDANTAAMTPDELASLVLPQAQAAAADGGGQLVIVQDAGGQPSSTVVDLAVAGPDGQKEHDATTRNAVIEKRVTGALDAAAVAPPAGAGRDVLGLLAAATTHAPGDGKPYDLYYVGLGLGTVDPADARQWLRLSDTTATTPTQAAGQVAGKLPGLNGARLHLIFTAPAGPQPGFNQPTDQWRADWWGALAKDTGATIVTTQLGNPGPAAAGAATAPVIGNLPDGTDVDTMNTTVVKTTNTVAVTTTSVVPTTIMPSAPPPVPVMLGDSVFVLDHAKFKDRAAAVAALKALSDAAADHPGAYHQIVCVGRTRHIGPKGGAVQLSQERADAARDILVDALHVAVPVVADGRGYDDLIPGMSDMDVRQASVTCTLL